MMKISKKDFSSKGDDSKLIGGTLETIHNVNRPSTNRPSSVSHKKMKEVASETLSELNKQQKSEQNFPLEVPIITNSDIGDIPEQ